MLINTYESDARFINDFAGQVANWVIVDLLVHSFFFLKVGSKQLKLYFLAS